MAALRSVDLEDDHEVAAVRKAWELEAKLLYFVNGHANCVQFFGACYSPPGLVFELCDQGSLQDCLWVEKRVKAEDGSSELTYAAPESKRALSTSENVRCVHQLVGALQYLHAKGVIHR